MALSACSDCKNYSEGICLLGQSYVDVFQTVQENFEPLGKDAGMVSKLASCSFWEESELSKLFSCLITLSYQSWEHIASLKLNGSSSENFKNLIDAARGVVMMTESEKRKNQDLKKLESRHESNVNQYLVDPDKDNKGLEEDLDKAHAAPDPIQTIPGETLLSNAENSGTQDLEQERVETKTPDSQEPEISTTPIDKEDVAVPFSSFEKDQSHHLEETVSTDSSDVMETIMEDFLNMINPSDLESGNQEIQGYRGSGRDKLNHSVA